MAQPAVRVRGLAHLALKVRDVGTARAFYTESFGMRVVWEPDAQNVYLSSGTDNLALHESADVGEGGALDHLGFLVDSADAVFAAAEALRARGVPILHEARRHRDGTVSCYCQDPDGNVVQVLWIPETA